MHHMHWTAGLMQHSMQHNVRRSTKQRIWGMPPQAAHQATVLAAAGHTRPLAWQVDGALCFSSAEVDSPFIRTKISPRSGFWASPFPWNRSYSKG